MPAARIAGRAGRGALRTFGRAPRAAEVTPSGEQKPGGRAEGFSPPARPPLFVLTRPRARVRLYLLPPRALGLGAPWVLVRSFFFRFISPGAVESETGAAPELSGVGGHSHSSNASMLT